MLTLVAGILQFGIIPVVTAGYPSVGGGADDDDDGGRLSPSPITEGCDDEHGVKNGVFTMIMVGSTINIHS